MGEFRKRLDASGDPRMIAKATIEMWLADFALEYSNAGSHYDKVQLIRKWFG